MSSACEFINFRISTIRRYRENFVACVEKDQFKHYTFEVWKRCRCQHFAIISNLYETTNTSDKLQTSIHQAKTCYLISSYTFNKQVSKIKKK